jgi:DNA modification methylase
MTTKERCLHEIFGVPPISQLDCKQGYWKKLRKRLVEELKLNSASGRGDNVLQLSSLLQKKQKGTSEFDPVLAYITYTWFSRIDDVVFDPFCGGSVRGVVAASLDRKYIGVDIRLEQIEENRRAFSLKPVTYIHSDSAALDETPEHDLFFTCPPYLDLEKYSDLKGDLSNMNYTDFWKYYEIILTKGLNKLRMDRFAIIVVGDVRDNDGFYVGLPNKTIGVCEKLGLRLYNDTVYLQEPVTAAMRAFNSMNSSRKIPKAHQNFLVFCKGNPKAASERLPQFVDQ